MRKLLLAGVSLLLLLAVSGKAQPPGGGDGREASGRAGGMAERIFNQFSGGRDSLERSRLTDPEQQANFDRMAQMLGVTNGVITRQQFLDLSSQMGGRPGGQRPGSPVMITGAPGATGAAAPTPSPMTPAGLDVRRGGRQQQGMDRAENRFRSFDRNGDGILSNDEIPDTLRNERERWDSDRNGFVDLNEYRGFLQGRMEQSLAERASLEQTQGGGNGAAPRPQNGAAAQLEAAASMFMNRAGQAGFGQPPTLQVNQVPTPDRERPRPNDNGAGRAGGARSTRGRFGERAAG